MLPMPPVCGREEAKRSLTGSVTVGSRDRSQMVLTSKSNSLAVPKHCGCSCRKGTNSIFLTRFTEAHPMLVIRMLLDSLEFVLSSFGPFMMRSARATTATRVGETEQHKSWTAPRETWRVARSVCSPKPANSGGHVFVAVDDRVIMGLFRALGMM
jgi:hypothetical protein